MHTFSSVIPSANRPNRFQGSGGFYCFFEPGTRKLKLAALIVFRLITKDTSEMFLERPLAAVLRERRRVFPHEREDSGGFKQLDLLVFREDDFGCFAPLSGVFPSAFVQAVWVAVALEQNLTLDDFVEGERGNRNKKNGRNLKATIDDKHGTGSA
jgi:hypothetical protein